MVTPLAFQTTMPSRPTPPLVSWSAGLDGAAQTGQNVLLVCNGSTKPCPPGASIFSTVQGAVNAAKSGDWILIWPGVYHEKSTRWPTAGVWIQKPNLHIRGLNRNGVIIDGSNGTASKPCPSSPALQDLNGGVGRNGIEVFKASGVTIQNLTVCDYLSGPGGHGFVLPLHTSSTFCPVCAAPVRPSRAPCAVAARAWLPAIAGAPASISVQAAPASHHRLIMVLLSPRPGLPTMRHSGP